MGRNKDISQDETGSLAVQLPSLSVFERTLGRVVFAKRPKLLLYILAPVITIILGLLALFFVPSSLQYSLSSETCAFNPMFLPRLSKHTGSTSYALAPSKSLSIAGYPILSTATCLQTIAAPVAGQVEKPKIALLNIPFLVKNFSVSPAELPLASAKFSNQSEVSTIGNLEFGLSTADLVFDYQISGNDSSANCVTAHDKVECNLSNLNLLPGTDYKLTLHRLYQGQPVGELLGVNIKTLDPVIIGKTSIKNSAIVYDTPSEITLKSNKPLTDAGAASLNGTSAATSFDGNTITIKLPKLEREKDYALVLERPRATDDSTLLDAFKLSFKTSGGPKVKSINIGNSRVQPWTSVTLSFDSPLKSGQNWSKFARIQVGGKTIKAILSASGKQLIINPSADLPRCKPFKVVLDSGLVSKYDIGGGKSYSLDSRTLCQEVFSIGSSVRDRSILAYRFGSGNSRIVFVGGMHGNEYSSVATLEGFINYLEDHAGEIPKHRQIIIIPRHNPDGIAAGTRTNANGVDLNRNWPASDWKAKVHMPGGVVAKNGGGKKAGDQPETKALLKYINSVNPRLVLTYHAVANVVISNDAGDSVSLGKKYAAASGYRFTTDANSDDEFDYPTTGEFEDWLVDVKGKPALLIEQAYMITGEFERQRTAFMNLVRLP